MSEPKERLRSFSSGTSSSTYRQWAAFRQFRNRLHIE
jgi:hypothetical protein